MAQRHAYGDRFAMEQLLEPEELDALHAQCDAARVTHNAWHRVSGIAMAWENVAVRRLAAQLQHARALSRDNAEAAAALELGLNPATIRSRFERWAVRGVRTKTQNAGVTGSPAPVSFTSTARS